jgi:hypothetical protein
LTEDGVTIRAVWDASIRRTEFIKNGVLSGVSEGSRIDDDLAKLCKENADQFAVYNAVVHALEGRRLLRGVRPHGLFVAARKSQ